jgi:hypothetical protein
MQTEIAKRAIGEELAQVKEAVWAELLVSWLGDAVKVV